MPVTDYHPSNLIRLKAKGNKWYVQVTKPEALQTPTSKQERRSTGTTDRKIAQQRQHIKTQEIYRKFDSQLGVNHSTPLPKANYINSHPDPFVMYRPWPAFSPDDQAKRILVLRPSILHHPLVDCSSPFWGLLVSLKPVSVRNVSAKGSMLHWPRAMIAHSKGDHQASMLQQF
jgi:hypothetical protein